MSFTQVQIDGKKAAPDRIYYNATVVNNSFSTIQQQDDPAIVFQDARQNPLVADSSNYEVSVQNFTLNGAPKTLPLFIPQISPVVLTKSISSALSIGKSFSGGPDKIFVKYLVSGTNLTPGLYVKSVSGTTEPYFNFSIPQLVVEADSTSFTVENFTGVAPATGSTGGTVKYQDPTDISTTIYTVSIGIAGSIPQIIAEPIIWVPENRAPYTTVPTTALPTQLESDYYYVYTYSHWNQLVNTALNEAWKKATTSQVCGTQCPWFEYDQESGLFSLNQDSKTSMTPAGVTLASPFNVAYTVVAPYQANEFSFVGMNTCLESLYSNFPSIYYAYGTQSAIWTGGGQIPEVVFDTGLTVDVVTGLANTDTPVGLSLRSQPKGSAFQLANPFVYGPLPGCFIRIVQDFISTGGIWSPIASFVLGTSQVPVRNEASANPITFGSANIGGNSSNSGAFQKVLVETPINALTADVWKGFIFYEPKTLTYSSLDPSHDGITDVDISLYWRNRLTNSIIPVRLPNQGTVSFRLLFKRKIAL
jgi:hypothetical protein